MKATAWDVREPHAVQRLDAPELKHAATHAPVAPALNTILAVREHAPAEIEELASEIEALHNRLAAAQARKRLLEQLLTVIHDADDPNPQSRMTVVR